MGKNNDDNGEARDLSWVWGGLGAVAAVILFPLVVALVSML